MLRTLGRDEFSDDLIDSWVGNGAQVLVKRALSASVDIDKNIDSTFFEEALSIFLQYYKNNLCEATLPYKDVKETLELLHKNAYKLVIITNKPSAFIEPILTKLEMFHLFSFCLGGDSLEEKKPHPLPLIYACEKLNFSIEDALMIGDSKNDILAAKAANIESIGVSYGYNYGEDIRVYNPEVVVDNFIDILKVLH